MNIYLYTYTHTEACNLETRTRKNIYKYIYSEKKIYYYPLSNIKNNHTNKQTNKDNQK